MPEEKENIYEPPSSEIIDVSSDSSINVLASRWARLGGSLIDTIILLALIMPIAYFSGYFNIFTSDQINIMDTVYFLLLFSIAFLILNGYLLTKYGQSIGKKLVNIKIISVDSEKILPLEKVFFLRFLPIILISQIPLIGSFIGLIDSLMIFASDKRCLHDHIAGTKVVNVINNEFKQEI